MKENDIIFKYESTEGMENYRNSSHMSKYIKYFLIVQSFEKNIERVVRENDKVKIFEKPLIHKRNKTNKNCQNQLFDDSGN